MTLAEGKEPESMFPVRSMTCNEEMLRLQRGWNLKGQYDSNTVSSTWEACQSLLECALEDHCWTSPSHLALRGGTMTVESTSETVIS